MTLEKGSLILLDYTAKIKDTNEIFETTRMNDIKDTPDFDPEKKYEPRLLGVGDGWVLKGLDEALLNANVGDILNIEITPDKAFGERDPSKIRMIPLRKLGEKANEVSVGDVIEIDNRVGIIRFIGSGRVQVDFNHKFAGRTIVYDANVIKKIEEDKDKIDNLIKRRLPVSVSEIPFEMNESEVQIKLPEPTFLIDGIQIIKRGISNDLFKYVPKLKNVVFLEKYSNATNNVTDNINTSDSHDGKEQQPSEDLANSNTDNSSLNSSDDDNREIATNAKS